MHRIVKENEEENEEVDEEGRKSNWIIQKIGLCSLQEFVICENNYE